MGLSSSDVTVSRRALAAGALFAAAMVIAAAPGTSAAEDPPADGPFRGDTGMELGASFHAAFPDPAQGPHRYSFFATTATTISASVVRDAGASLVPSLRLAFPGGLPVDLGNSLRGDTHIEKFRVPYAGVFVLEVAAKSGSGGYTLTTSGRYGRKLLGLFPKAPSGDEHFEFDAAQGAVLSVRVAPRHHGPRIEITGVTTPDGEALPVLSLQRRAAAEIHDVPLPEGGRYSLTWTNHGAPGDLRLQFQFRPPAGVPPLRELGVSDGTAASVIEQGDPALAARDGYVGSAVCGRCHEDLVRSWSLTGHNNATRSWHRAGLSDRNMVNDANRNGADDFHDGLDLATTPAFAAYGADAPKLVFVAGAAVPYQARVAGATYTVDRTMGGNGNWTQRYLTKIGANYYVLPFEYDEGNGAYLAYRAGDWLASPTKAGTERAAILPSKDRSFEAQCSGCHDTGEILERDAASGEIRTGYAELTIGCEQCHGPGAAHAVHGDTRKIKNPRKLIDGTPAGIAAAVGICGRCHTRGESADALPGSTTKTEFGLRSDRGLSQAGDVVTDFLHPTTAAEDFWGKKIDPLPTLPGDTTVAARTDRQQYPDLLAGAHAPNQGDSPACFDCHDPHQRKNEHQIAVSVNRGTFVKTQADDNSLCLACHAGDAKFPGTSKADAALIASGSPPAALARAVLDHMKDGGMPARDGTYDPLGTGVGQCLSCHEATTPSVGAGGPDKGGFLAGDLHSHRFEIVWPRASALYGVTNSCNVCHPTTPQDIVGPILTQWANPAPGKTYFHGATPPASQDGIALNLATNPSHAGDGERRCIACHTAEGFVALQVNHDRDRTPPEEVDKIAKESVGQDRGLSCDACHGRRDDGNFYGSDRNPLRIDKAELCGTCHNAETIGFADFRDHGAVVRHPQREMLEGTAGDAPAGAPATATTTHSRFVDGCVTCHFDSDAGVATHTFEPNVATCASCHKGLATFDRPATADYDGDGFVRGIQTEVTGLLGVLKAALLLDPQMHFAGGRFDYGAGTNHALTGATDVQKRAVFNWYSVDDDKSRGVHNAARALQLLQKSYRELTGSDVPGATLR